MYALSRDRDDTLVAEEELLDATLGPIMAPIRGISLQLWAVERRNASLDRVLVGRIRDPRLGTRVSTHIFIACPKQFLGIVKYQ